MKSDPQEIDRRLEQLRVDLDHRRQPGHWAVGRDEVPGAIEYHRWKGLVRGEDSVERLAHGLELRIGEGALGKCRRVTGDEQELISFPERDLELLGNRQEHLTPRLGATGLDEAQMAR